MAKSILRKLAILLIISACQSAPIDNETNPKKETAPGDFSIGTTHLLTSKILHEDREIIVSLPNDYDKSNASYPVLYLTDGFQNLAHVSGSIEILTRTGHIPPIILVGIKSVDRTRDFTMTRDPNNTRSGGGKEFLAFIEKELIPYIDQTYKTNSFRVLEGHSLGGLFAASVLLEKPELFQAFIIMSPSLWWNGEELTQQASKFLTSHQNLEKSLFFGIGTKESSRESGMRKELTNFIDVLRANKPHVLRLAHREFEDEGHMSSPMLSNYHGLRYIFSDLRYSDSFKDNYSDEAFLKKEQEIVRKYGQRAKRTGESYYELGSAIYQQNLPGAITVFKRSIEVYPDDLNLINTLAILYEANADTANAIATYQYAIEVTKKSGSGNEQSFEKEINRLNDK